MNKHKWYKLILRSSFEAFQQTIADLQFSANRDFWFVELDEFDRKRCPFTYLRRSRLLIPHIDSVGNMGSQAVETVSSFRFEIFEHGSQVWMMIENPPRSIREFLDVLENVAGFGFSIEPYIFSTDSQERALAGFDSAVLVGFRGVASSSEQKMVARFDVASKVGLVPDNLSMLKGLNFKMDQTTYEVSYEMLKGQVTFMSSGVVRSTGAITPFILTRLEYALITEGHNN